MCVHVCVCVRERERSVRVWNGVGCVCAIERERELVCVWNGVRRGGGSKAFMHFQCATDRNVISKYCNLEKTMKVTFFYR